MGRKVRLLLPKVDYDTCFCESFVKIVEERFEVVMMAEYEKNRDKYKDIEGIISWEPYVPNITKELLDALSKLKIVATISSGYDHLDTKLISSYGVKITNTAGVLSNTVAEMAMSLLLCSARRILHFASKYKSRSPGDVMKSVNDMTPQVFGSTLGIVGLGGIGYSLAKQAAGGFNMKILYHQRHKRSLQDEQAVGATYYAKLNEMLPHCDFIVIALRLTPATKHLIGREQFKLMKKSAIFVNITRGDTVDQDALVETLKRDGIHGAGLDVTSPEPLHPDHELLKLPNVIVTPHIGAQTLPNRLAMLRLVLDNIQAAIDGKELLTEIPSY